MEQRIRDSPLPDTSAHPLYLIAALIVIIPAIAGLLTIAIGGHEVTGAYLLALLVRAAVQLGIGAGLYFESPVGILAAKIYFGILLIQSAIMIDPATAAFNMIVLALVFLGDKYSDGEPKYSLPLPRLS